MKAVIYARVSSREQEETGYSLDAQVKLLTEYASNKDIAVARVFRVSESASKSLVRKTLREMLTFAEKNKVDLILCEKIDRLTRNLKDAAVVDDWVHEKEGREVHFVKEHFILNQKTKAHDNFVWDMKVAVARFYTNNLSEEVRKGYAEKLAQGGRPGRSPLGYRSVDDGGRKKHVVDENTGPTVRRLFESYATGNYSMDKIREMAREGGLLGRTGRPLGLSQIAYLLQQPFYYGAIKWNGKMYDYAVHEPLISKETYDRVQDIRTGKKAPKYQKHQFRFRKMLTCGECNGTITAEIKKGRYVYYHCNHYHDCSQTGVTREERIEEQVVGVFKFFESITPEEAERIRMKVKESHAAEAAYKENAINNLNERYAQLQRRLDTLYDDRLDKKITNEFWEKKNAEITEEQRGLQEQLTALKAEEAKYFDIWLSILDLAFRARELYELGTPAEKRLIISHIFSNLVLTGGIVKPAFKTTAEKLFQRVQEKIEADSSFELSRHSQDKGRKSKIAPNDALSKLERAQ